MHMHTCDSRNLAIRVCSAVGMEASSACVFRVNPLYKLSTDVYIYIHMNMHTCDSRNLAIMLCSAVGMEASSACVFPVNPLYKLSTDVYMYIYICICIPATRGILQFCCALRLGWRPSDLLSFESTLAC